MSVAIVSRCRRYNNLWSLEFCTISQQLIDRSATTCGVLYISNGGVTIRLIHLDEEEVVGEGCEAAPPRFPFCADFQAVKWMMAGLRINLRLRSTTGGQLVSVLRVGAYLLDSLCGRSHVRNWFVILHYQDSGHV